MKFCLASIRDVKSLAHLHVKSSKKQPDAFLHKLGPRFLEVYYQSLLADGSSVILCAKDTNGRILGFCSGSIDIEDRIITLRQNRIKLALTLIIRFLHSPSLISKVLVRNKQKFFNHLPSDGAHVDYWCWDNSGNSGAIILFRKWLSLMTFFGCKRIYGEVDNMNKEVYALHKILGAKFKSKFTTPDGQSRSLIVYEL